MVKAIRMEVKPDEIIEAVKRMNKRERVPFLEDLIASVSPEHLESIKEARADYKAGRVKTHEEIFSHCATNLFILIEQLKIVRRLSQVSKKE
jgi:predicted transcriptional regulator